MKFIYRNHNCVCHWRGQCMACGKEQTNFDQCLHHWNGPIKTIGASATRTCSKCGTYAKEYYEAHPTAIQPSPQESASE